MALSVEERNGLLEQAWELGRARNYPAVAELLAPVANEELITEPELGYWLAAGWKYLGRWEQALELLRQLTEPCRRLGNSWVYRHRMNLEGGILIRAGRLLEARTIALALLDAAHEAGDELAIVYATINLGIISDIECRWEEALANYHLALAICQRLGDRPTLGVIHNNLGMACCQLALLDEADAHFQKAVNHFQAAGGSEPIGISESERALLLNLMGDPRLAEATVRRALWRLRDLGHRAGEGNCLRVLAIIVAGQGRRDEAKRCLEDALEKVQTGGDRLTEAEVLEEMAVLDQQAGNDAAAPALAEAACAIYLELGAPLRAEKLRARLAALT